MSGPEKSFENKIKKYLDDNDCYFVKFFANRMTKVGVPDILACVNGNFIGIEVKSETGTPSELQKYNIERIKLAGGTGVIVRPSDFAKLKEIIICLKNQRILRAWQIANEINAKFF